MIDYPEICIIQICDFEYDLGVKDKGHIHITSITSCSMNFPFNILNKGVHTCI